MDIDKSSKIAVLAVSSRGAKIGRRLKKLLPGSRLYLPAKFTTPESDEIIYFLTLKDAVSRAFSEYKSLVLIMATGIAVRMLAPLIKDKHTDPGVVVVDDEGNYAISLLSGHVGGANDLARKVAGCLGARPVVTTASDISGVIPVDLLGREFGWEIEDSRNVTPVSAALVNGELIGVYQDAGERDLGLKKKSLPENVRLFSSLPALHESNPGAALIITDRILEADELSLLPELNVVYRPKSLVVGIGCNRGVSCGEIESAVNQVFAGYQLSTKSIKNLATIDLKKDEPGILEYSWKYNLRVDYFDSETLGKTETPSPASETVLKYVGAPAVCEAAAVLSSGGPVFVPKVNHQRTITLAVARVPFDNANIQGKGKLYIIGTGPGGPDQMTSSAREAIEQSEIVVGYKTYIELIRPLLAQKEISSTGMGAEIERIKMALDLAKKGQTVAVISSGDAGVYGMAGLMGEIISEGVENNIEIEVIPGVPALAAAAALLGSPLSNDFACISLSDHLVPWETIRERLKLAARGDFVIVVYNPRSRQRPYYLAEARELILEYRQPSTKVGIVTNAYREGQKVVITDLAHLLDYEINMNSTVIVGNSRTRAVRGWMLTPRGYQSKYDLK